MSTQVVVDWSRAWITTYTGKAFYHLNPQPEQICIEDIAHALSMICRWTGHTKYHYSVAQHSVYVSYLVPFSDAKKGLLHDSPEAYLGDMNRPLKHYTEAGVVYTRIEESVEHAIFEKFGLTPGIPESVKVADTQMLYTEKDQLINPATSTMYEAGKWGSSEKRANLRIVKWSPEEAERMFLDRFKELFQGE
jgi:5'-nucleotidase